MFRLVLGAALFATTAQAQGVQQKAQLSEVCEAYAKVVIESLAGESSVAIGRIMTEERFGLATGRGVEFELKKALGKEQPGVVAPKAKHEVRGVASYRGQKNKVRYAHFQFDLIELATGKVVPAASRRFVISELIDVARMFGPTVQIEAGSNQVQRVGQMEKAIDTPGGAVVQGTKVAPGATSPYSFEVLVTTNNARDRRPITLDNGQPVVSLQKTDTFELVVVNGSDTEIGARLFIDGIDSYSFAQKRADGKPFASAYRIDPKGAWRLMGWHFTQATWEEFQLDKPKTVDLPPAQDTKWSSATIIIWTIRPNPNMPGRYIAEEPLDFITIRMGSKEG